MSAPKEVKETGRIYYDREDGWYLQGDEPGSCVLFSDLVRDFHNQEVEITVRVIGKQNKTCPSCGGPQPNGPETTSGKCLDCDRTSPSTGAHLKGE